MTGAPPTSDPTIGGTYTAWDGYIEGEHVSFQPPGLIVQTWWTSHFPEGAPKSRLEIRITPDGDGSRVTFVHTEIPEGQGKNYEEGWESFYLTPMRAYFGKLQG